MLCVPCSLCMLDDVHECVCGAADALLLSRPPIRRFVGRAELCMSARVLCGNRVVRSWVRVRGAVLCMLPSLIFIAAPPRPVHPGAFERHVRVGGVCGTSELEHTVCGALAQACSRDCTRYLPAAAFDGDGWMKAPPFPYGVPTYSHARCAWVPRPQARIVTASWATLRAASGRKRAPPRRRRARCGGPRADPKCKQRRGRCWTTHECLLQRRWLSFWKGFVYNLATTHTHTEQKRFV